MEAHLAEILNIIVGFVTAGILGLLKKYTTLLDTLWSGLIKHIQPAVVALMIWLVPLVAGKLGIDLGDPATWASTPVLTVVIVLLRELKEWLAKKFPNTIGAIFPGALKKQAAT